MNLLFWPHAWVGEGSAYRVLRVLWRTAVSSTSACCRYLLCHDTAQTLFDLHLASIKALHPTQATVDQQLRLHILTGRQLPACWLAAWKTQPAGACWVAGRVHRWMVLLDA